MQNLVRAFICLFAIPVLAIQNTSRPVLVPTTGHSGVVRSLAASLSNNLLASAGEDRQLIIWNLGSRKEVARITAHNAPVTDIAFCGSAPFLISASVDGTAGVWDIKRHKEVTNIGGAAVFSALAVAADCGKVIVGNSHGRSYLWEPFTDKKQPKLINQVRGAIALALSPDELLFTAANADGDVWICQVESLACDQNTVAATPIGVGFFVSNGSNVVWIATKDAILTWAPSDKPVWHRLGVELDDAKPREFQGSLYALAAGRIVSIDLRNASADVKAEILGPQILEAPGTSLLMVQPGMIAIAGSEIGEINIVETSRPAATVTKLVPQRQTLTTLSASGDSLTFAVDQGSIWKIPFRSGIATVRGELSQEERLIRYFSGTDKALVHVGGKGFWIVDFLTGRRWRLELDSDGKTGCSSHEPFLDILMSQDGLLYAACRNGSVFQFRRNGNRFTLTLWSAAIHTGIHELASMLMADDGFTLVLVGASNTQGDAYWKELLNSQLATREPKFHIQCRAVWVNTRNGHVARSRSFIAPAPITGATLSTHDQILILLDQFIGSDVAVPVVWGLWFDLKSGHSGTLRGQVNRVTSAAFSTTQRDVVVTGSEDGKLRFWQLGRPNPLMLETVAHTGTVRMLVSVPHKRFFISTGEEGHLVFWDNRDGHELCRVVRPGAFDQLVVKPDGRFDSSVLEMLSGVSWVFPDDPFRTLPPEVFMRDYFEPHLLARLLAHEKLNPIRPLSDLNRAQPKVTIVAVEDEPGNEGLVTIKVRVTSVQSEVQKDTQGRLRQSGAYDLRLFRDGQLVAQRPSLGATVESTTLPKGADIERAAWRERHCLLESGAKDLDIKHVQLPRRAEHKKVIFTAYAFNEDQVKSVTDIYERPVPAELPARTGMAYVISVGVNRTESSPAWDLQYAANDARRMSTVVGNELEGTKQFKEVVRIRLVSDLASKTRTGEGTATKKDLRTVLDFLAGRKVEDSRMHGLGTAGHIGRAQPEDLVILSISSHGYTDSRGVFHFVLADIGQTQRQVITDALNKSTLSSDELSAWLRDVDAGELVMVVDACQSEASIQIEGFKPGPMGSRGLGQLAYDKGMRVLAASKAKESAIERGGGINDGLLTYALVEEALAHGKADWQPKDGKIMITEWLAYAEKRVPQLFAQGDKKGIKAKGVKNRTRDAYHGANRTPPRYQQPVLFDFTKQQQQSIVAILPAKKPISLK